MEQEIFWHTIAFYNLITWPVQLIFIGIAIVLTLLLYQHPTTWVKISMKIFMALLNGWIAIAYYLVSCENRKYNEILALLWGIMAFVWIIDSIMNLTPFERSSRYAKIAWIFYLMPFLYPITSLSRGLDFPLMTTPVMPCSIAIYTLGLLFSFPIKANLFIILLIIHWAFIGIAKATFYEIPEDYILVCTILPSLYFFFKEYKEQLKP